MNPWGFEGNAPPNIYEQMNLSNMMDQTTAASQEALRQQQLNQNAKVESAQDLGQIQEAEMQRQVRNNVLESTQIEGITEVFDVVKGTRKP